MSINLLISIKIVKIRFDIFILSFRYQMTIVDIMCIDELTLYWTISLPLLPGPGEKVDGKLRIRVPVVASKMTAGLGFVLSFKRKWHKLGKAETLQQWSHDTVDIWSGCMEVACPPDITAFPLGSPPGQGPDGVLLSRIIIASAGTVDSECLTINSPLAAPIP